jgi:hypothetical protein
MSTFEEQFPSMDKKLLICDEGFSENTLMTFCLDKQRTIDIIRSAEEEIFYICDLDDKKAREIVRFILQEITNER